MWNTDRFPFTRPSQQRWFDRRTVIIRTFDVPIKLYTYEPESIGSVVGSSNQSASARGTSVSIQIAAHCDAGRVKLEP